jgi:hypothetical protein
MTGVSAGEGHAQFDHIDTGGRQAADDFHAGIIVRVTGHDERDEGGPALSLQPGEACVDAGHGFPL